MKPSLPLTLTALVLTYGAPFSSKAGIVLDWNNQALNAIQSSSTNTPMASRNLAMLQVAIYDAVNAIDGGHSSYRISGTAPTGASADAAAAAAANTILGALYPALGSSFTTLYNDQMTAIGSGQSVTDGINWGNAVATQILNWRAADGAANAATTPYTPSGQLGGWATTPHSNPAYNFVNPPLVPGWGNVTPFAMTSGSQFRPDPFNGQSVLNYLATSQYASDYNQVMSLGAKVGSTRTADQTAAAYFWEDRYGSITTAGKWNQIAQNLLGPSAGTAREALVMAALNVALADAAISSYDAKYIFDLWRPLTAIAYGDIDGNGATIGDGLAGIPGFGWEPLLDTPTSPELTSDGAALSSSAATVLKNYFGDVAISLLGDTNGDGLNDSTRSWASLSQAAIEAGMAGVYGGGSFNSSVTLAQTSGQSAASNVVSNYFLPVPEPGSLLLLSVGAGWIVRRRRTGQE
ncbi:MAG: PEP-CTERM sorting domain-containing protein [Verrucomicrobiaceae bacterium]|nr:PEP-CTERM sorting domain-containing protein [Verrucomicrobiaceae bacterium]